MLEYYPYMNTLILRGGVLCMVNVVERAANNPTIDDPFIEMKINNKRKENAIYTNVDRSQKKLFFFFHSFSVSGILILEPETFL